MKESDLQKMEQLKSFLERNVVSLLKEIIDLAKEYDQCIVLKNDEMGVHIEITPDSTLKGVMAVYAEQEYQSLIEKNPKYQEEQGSFAKHRIIQRLQFLKEINEAPEITIHLSIWYSTWQEAVDTYFLGIYDPAVIVFAEMWGRIMQGRLESGRATQSRMPVETAFMVGSQIEGVLSSPVHIRAARKILSYWKHRDIFGQEEVKKQLKEYLNL